MPLILLVLIAISALSFLFFGYTCLTSPFMVMEFDRYGLSAYRRLTGYLQLMGAVALLAGIFYTPLALVGSGGLSLLMFLGVGVRIRIQDRFLKTLPALIYALLNLWIFIKITAFYSG